MDSLDETIEIEASGKKKIKETYKVLHTIEFDSTRKRMSVIVIEKDGRIRMMTKGADNIMLARISEKSKPQLDSYNKHLDAFSCIGLRTLVFASKYIEQAEYDAWAKKYLEAELLTDGREEAMEKLASDFERDLDIVGCSAIEDKLQERVPQTIKKLKEGGIKVWVLTGDKLETAINIAMSCQLLTPEMQKSPTPKDEDTNGFFVVKGETFDDVEAEIAKWLKEIEARKKELGHGMDQFGLVVTGAALLHPLPPTKREIKDDLVSTPRLYTDAMLIKQKDLEMLFLKLAKQCAAVVCCRVSPLQKAKVVDCVKINEKAITLAIGDGANDVSMIKTAHIGIGISGLEGRQAVLASDYAIGQFRFLGRLLLVHGRWSYFRMTAFLRYFFYKGFVYVQTHHF